LPGKLSSSSSILVFRAGRAGLTLLLTQLAGLWIFYEDQDDQVVHDKVLAGERPRVDSRLVRTGIDRRLVEIMEQCWESDPDRRIDIFRAIALLRRVLDEENDEAF